MLYLDICAPVLVLTLLIVRCVYDFHEAQLAGEEMQGERLVRAAIGDRCKVQYPLLVRGQTND